MLLLSLLMTAGCDYLIYDSSEVAIIGGADGPTSIIVAESAAPESTQESTSESAETVESSARESVSESSVAESVEGSSEAVESSAQEPVSESSEEAPSEEALLDPDGSYTTCEDVALYLETYGELPKNFMTKNEARALGWEGGSLEPYAPGMCIGGDKFGNYEGNLPKAKGRTYKECDIDTLGARSRGAKRIVFSNDGLIYYTDDHYESFTLLYE